VISLGVLALLAVIAATIWPRQGLYARWQRGRKMGRQVRREDALKHILSCQLAERPLTLEGLAGALEMPTGQVVQVLTDLEQRELIIHQATGYSLTTRGERAALHILRAHRLWESYLAEETGFHQIEWHGQAEAREHQLDPDQVAALASQLGQPTHDPHGDPIPTAEGHWVQPAGLQLAQAEVETDYRIIHIEDEPEEVYAQLLAEGLHLGQRLRVVERLPRAIRFLSEGDEHVLAPLLAENLTIEPLPAEIPAGSQAVNKLSQLASGESAVVAGIAAGCRGPERRRLLDLGLVAGTDVRAEMVSPSGDPKAYRIRGALIALRREQADYVQVRKVEMEND
jgi:DtxR family Mn-dependent transcriptional regulator